jgi:hypothetical protein
MRICWWVEVVPERQESAWCGERGQLQFGGIVTGWTGWLLRIDRILVTLVFEKLSCLLRGWWGIRAKKAGIGQGVEFCVLKFGDGADTFRRFRSVRKNLRDLREYSARRLLMRGRPVNAFVGFCRLIRK